MNEQTGITTNQILNADLHSYYIWPNNNFHYVRLLAEHLGRKDLKFITKGFLREDCFRGYGRFRKIYVDHAVELSLAQARIVAMNNQEVRREMWR